MIIYVGQNLIVKAEMLVCGKCLKVFDLVPRLEVGCNLDPLGSKKVVVVGYVDLILIVMAEILVCISCLKVVELVIR